MLLRFLKTLRLINKREFAKVVEEQRDALKSRRDDAEAAGALREARVLTMKLERKERALARAKKAAGMLLALSMVQFTGCAATPLRDTLEVAAVATNKALKHCEEKFAPTAGDESQKAQADRRECLKVPDLEERMDAVDAVAYEMEQARYWILTGQRP